MAITKEYLDSIRFDIAKQKYYNAGKVDAKLDELKQEVLTLLDENVKLRKAADDVKSAKDEIGGAVINAQAQAKAAVEQAEAEAARLIKKAESDAEAITADAKAFKRNRTKNRGFLKNSPRMLPSATAPR